MLNYQNFYSDSNIFLNDLQVVDINYFFVLLFISEKVTWYMYFFYSRLAGRWVIFFTLFYVSLFDIPEALEQNCLCIRHTKRN